MSVFRLSRAGIVVCTTALLLLLTLTLYGAFRMQAMHDDMISVHELQGRIHALSVASESLAMLGGDAGLWRAYAAEAGRIQHDLAVLVPDYPEAAKAARRTGILVEAVARKIGIHDRDRSPELLDQTDNALSLSAADRIAMHQIVGQGTALDTALDEILNDWQANISARANRTTLGLAFSSLLFGMLCVVFFIMIRRRFLRPARSMARTLERIRSGEIGARVELRGDDEMNRLADALNRALDSRERAEARLKERERDLERALSEVAYTRDRLSRSQEVACIGGYDIDLATGAITWSDELLRILGVEREAFDGTLEAMMNFVHEDDREDLAQRRERWIERGRPGEFRAHYRIVRPDGSLRWIDARARLLEAQDGRSYSSGTLQDVTEKKRVDERLLQMEKLIEGTEDLCCVIDDSYRFLWVNEAYARSYGIDRNSICGISAPDVLGERYFEESIRPRADRCLRDGETQRFESTRDLPGIGPRRLLIRYYPIASESDSKRLVGSVITDVTDERDAQRELARQRQQLAIAGRVARFGAWMVDLDTGLCEWSDMVAEIHAMPHGYSPTVEEGIAFYAPEHRSRIAEVFGACVERGVPYDEELQIIDADGVRHWVRTIGEPVRDEQGRTIRVQGAFQDISSAKALEKERERLESRLASIVASITDGFIAVDREWRFVYLNEDGARLIGEPAEQLLGEELWANAPLLAGTSIETALRRAMADGQTASVEEHLEPLDAWFDVKAYPNPEGVGVFFRDVSDRHELVARLQKQERDLRTSRDALQQAFDARQVLINSLPAHVAMLDHEGVVVDVNEQWRRFGKENDIEGDSFGVGQSYFAVCTAAYGADRPDAERAARGLREVLNGERSGFSMEYPCHSPERQRWFRLMVNPLRGPQGSSRRHGAVAMHVDVTERKRAEQELNRIAFEDLLTGTLSRNGFVSGLGKWAEQDRLEDHGVLAMLDVADLHDINDTQGYEAGDRLLIEFAQRLVELVGSDGLVGRTGGDQFAVFLVGQPGASPGKTVARIGRAVRDPFLVGDGSSGIRIDLHLGYTVLGDRRQRFEDVMREAELALFENRTASESAGTELAYSEMLDQQVSQRVRLTHELREAVKRRQFELHFQPKVDLSTGQVLSAEALLRWQHPERGLQPPGLFIPIAEQSRLIGPIGEWALREACRHLKEWQEADLDVVRIAVNVSQVQFRLGGFTEKVRRALEEFAVDPAVLTLEITESVFENQSEKLLNELKELSALGVRLSLDDFGTGYSSLLYLQRYPFDEIKVDRGFVDRILDDVYSRDIVVAVLNLARAIDAEVVAEGIESQPIADALLKMGCRMGQGFHYSVPLESEDFRWLLEQRCPLPLKHN